MGIITDPPRKLCIKCEADKPLTDFNKSSKSLDGKQAYCRACQKLLMAQYRQAHPEKVKEWNQIKHARHGDRYRAQNRARYHENIVQSRAQNNERRKKHAEHHRQSVKDWQKRNPNKVREYSRITYQRTRKRAPEMLLAKNQRRRARELNTMIGPVDFRAIWERDQGICHICGLFVPPEHCHYDHVIPLARGGTHTMNNIKVSHSWCNRRKAAKLDY
jgi:5-methylcytosine-specific restriction endonuclease McrA